MRIDLPMIRSVVCFERCPLSDRLLGPLLVELSWNLIALKFHTMHAKHLSTVQD